MSPNITLWLSLGAALLAVIYGFITVRWVLSLSPGNARMQEIAAAIQEGAKAYMNRQYTTIAIAGVVLFAILGFALNWETAHRFRDRRGVLGPRGLHRHVRLGARERAHGAGGDERPERGAQGRVPRRRGHRAPRRRPGPARRRGLLRRAALDGLRAGADSQSARRPRVRRLADLDLRASRRRHLHEGRGRRRGPRRQGRSRHSRGRPAQPGRDRRQRRRQRRRLRRHGRGPVRDLRRDVDRDDAARRPHGRVARRERRALPDRARRGVDRRVDHRHVLRQHQDRQDHARAVQGRRRLRRPRRDRVLPDHDVVDGRDGQRAEPVFRGADRPRAHGRDGRDHRVLHGHELQPGEEDRRGVDDRPRDQHDRGPRRVDEVHGAARARGVRRRSGARSSSASSTASRSRPRACCR